MADDIQEKSVVNRLLYEYQEHQQEKWYSSVMNIITNANKEIFKEVSGMCEALEEIYLEIHGERLKREQQEAVDRAVEAAVEEVTAERDAYKKELNELRQQLGMATV